MTRGSVAIVVLPRDLGKPRPAVIVQSQLFQALPSVIVVPLTTHLQPEASLLRIRLEPTAANGLLESCDAMIDKVSAVDRRRIGKVIGTVSDVAMARIAQALLTLLGLP